VLRPRGKVGMIADFEPQSQVILNPPIDASSEVRHVSGRAAE